MSLESLAVDEVFGQRVKELRKSQGLGQDELAARVKAIGGEIGRLQIGRIENAQRGVSFAEALQLAAALGVWVGSLLEDEGLVAIGENLQLPFSMIGAWLRCEAALRPEHIRTYFVERNVQIQLEPDEVLQAMAEQRPEVKAMLDALQARLLEQMEQEIPLLAATVDRIAEPAAREALLRQIEERRAEAVRLRDELREE